MSFISRFFRLKRYFIIWVIALLSATGYYALDRLAISYLMPGEKTAIWLNGGSTIVSPDDEYYVSPPENWLAGHGWRRSPALGHGSYIHRVVVGPKKVYASLLVSQLFVFAMSAVAFTAILRRLIRQTWVQVIALSIYIMSPWFLSYSFYSITEALAVPLIVFELYFVCRAYQTVASVSKGWAYTAAAICWSMATLTRPFTGLSALLLAIVMGVDYLLRPSIANWRLLSRHVLLAGSVPLLLFGSWTVRNYLVTGEIVLLERYSHPESIDGYKPAFNAAWNLYAASGVKQQDFYKGLPVMYIKVNATGKPDSILLEETLSIIPADKRVAMGGDAALRAALKAYQQLLIEQYYPFVAHPVRPMPSSYSVQEMSVVRQFEFLQHQLYYKQPQMYIIGPALVMKEAVLHSNTSNMALFDQRIRIKYWFINAIRLLLLVVHLSLYVGLAISWLRIIRLRSTILQLGLIIPPTLLLLALGFWVHTTEQRYMLPFLSFLLLNAALLIDGFRQPSITSSSG
jgi:hypothetical protein